jgi:hypothetical protein
MSAVSDPARITMQDTPNGLNISIPAKFDLHVMVLTLLVFGLNVVFLVASLRDKDFFAILWAAVAFLCVRAMLWNTRGCERISVDGRTLTVRFEMPGIRETSSFDLSDVDTFRTFESRGVRRLFTFMMLPNQRGRIIFDYKGKIQAFGADLSLAEAEGIIRRIEQYSSTKRGTRKVALAAGMDAENS